VADPPFAVKRKLTSRAGKSATQTAYKRAGAASESI
jgi:hypothetical protein